MSTSETNCSDKQTCRNCPWWTNKEENCNLQKRLELPCTTPEIVYDEIDLDYGDECPARRAFRILRDEIRRLQNGLQKIANGDFVYDEPEAGICDCSEAARRILGKSKHTWEIGKPNDSEE